jgi:hypothetical protein
MVLYGCVGGFHRPTVRTQHEGIASRGRKLANGGLSLFCTFPVDWHSLPRRCHCTTRPWPPRQLVRPRRLLWQLPPPAGGVMGLKFIHLVALPKLQFLTSIRIPAVRITHDDVVAAKPNFDASGEDVVPVRTCSVVEEQPRLVSVGVVLNVRRGSRDLNVAGRLADGSRAGPVAGLVICCESRRRGGDRDRGGSRG